MCVQTYGKGPHINIQKHTILYNKYYNDDSLLILDQAHCQVG